MDPFPGAGDEDVPSLIALWGVGAVATRLGIAAPTLRTWDRRYGLGPSRRTEGGHRRYTEADVARVDLMSRLIADGVPAAEAATVAQSRTQALPRVPRGRVAAPQTARSAGTAVDALVRAAAELDAATLSRIARQALERHGVVGAWTKVAVPALTEIGRQWESGRIGIEGEHLVSERLGAELRAITRAGRSHRPASAQVVIAGAAGEQHYLPVLALEAALAERRIGSVALGPRTPTAALAAAVERRDPRVVFIWRTMGRPAEDAPASDLRALVHRHVLLGGPGWTTAETDAYGTRRVARVHDLPSAVERIEALVRTGRRLS